MEPCFQQPDFRQLSGGKAQQQVELWFDDTINLAFQSVTEDQKCCDCMTQSSDQKELATKVEVVFKEIFMD